MHLQDTEPVDKSTSEHHTIDISLSVQSVEEVMENSAPESWSIEQVTQWLSLIGLEELTDMFKENEINGSLLIDDGFDDATVKKFIPKLKHQILFNRERMKLRSQQQQKSTVSTVDINDINVTLKAIGRSDTEVLSSKKNNQSLSDNDKQNNNTQYYRDLPAARVGSKATCPTANSIVVNINNLIDLKYLLQDVNCIHSVEVNAEHFNVDDYELLKTLSLCLCCYTNIDESTELDQIFNTLVDKSIDAQALVEELDQNHSLKVYVVDSLKKYHALMDIIHILPSCTELQSTDSLSQHREIIDNFLDITEKMTKSVLLTTTIDSMSYESQRYFGNFIKKNDLPVPFAYYAWNEQKHSAEYKINFNLLAEIMCSTDAQYVLQVGSKSTMGIGKTSMLQFIFPDKHMEALNTDGSSALRNGCIDVLFSSDTNRKSESYVIFDVHGTINTLNEDIITSIQEYSTLQIFYVTEEDLNSVFLNSMMNYSKHTQEKPTIVIIFDPNYDDKRYQAEKIINAFKSKYENWKYIKWATASPARLWYQSDNNKKNKDLARSKRLLETFSGMSRNLNEETRQKIPCTSIFSIQYYYFAVKTSTNVHRPIDLHCQIENRLTELFGDLNDKTENLPIVTPISYLDSAIKQCERDLLDNWDTAKNETQARRDDLIRQRTNITTIGPYTAFFIDLLTKYSYIELLITEKYLDKWRSEFESKLLEQSRIEKNVALKLSSKIKQLEERLSPEKNFSTTERMRLQQELDATRFAYNKQHVLVTQINNKLMNIDLTIGLFCDEIMALYELSPHLFGPKNPIENIAKTLTTLMLKGFAIHILRDRPLRCHSKLIEQTIKFIQTTQQPPLVLTVIGEQSSAKSSLMNTTFGCNFRVSAGRCTIGIYMSVIQWRSETIVIFDTEGLLSLEEAGSIFDNQMVTMAILSSHLVLINHKGEFSSNLKDLIGMSFYAKLNIQSPIKPKLLFVLRDQAELESKVTFFRQLTQLKEQLQNDTKFLKISIDDELDISDENVYLLPCAFSYGKNPISSITQCCRNEIFPQEIIKLREIIFNNITSTTIPQKLQFLKKTSTNFSTTQNASRPQTPTVDPAYTDMTHLYTKISSNWEIIDRLGPRLLECKTLYELSIMKELQTIANEIIQTTNVTVYQEGENLTEQTLSHFSKNNSGDVNHDRIVEKFNHQLNMIITRAIDQAQKNFNDKTERSCYLPEIKLKISKRIEPPIHSTQHLLKELFEERLNNLLRKTRINNAQKQLLDSVQKQFEEKRSLQFDDLKTRLETDFKRIIEQHEKDLQSSFETENIITDRILKFYNEQLRCKQGDTRKESIHTLLSPIVDRLQLKRHLEKLEYCLSQSEEWPTHQPVEISGRSYFSKAFKSLFTTSSEKDTDHQWTQLKNNLKWFTNDRREEKNKKLFMEIWYVVIQTFGEDLLKLITNTQSFSSNPKIVQHLFQCLENAMNWPCIKNNFKSLEKPILCSDIAIIGLNIIINEAIRQEIANYESNLENSKNEIMECRKNLLKQCTAMKSSYESGQTLAETIGKQIIDGISAILQRRIEKEVNEDIVRSQFINHESIQKQAYQESISQANGENILKYVYDINRYFIELSLREIKTTLHTVTHKHTLDLENCIILAIDKACNCVQQGTYKDTWELRDHIQNGIIKLKERGDAELFGMFSLNNIICMPIEEPNKFQQGFQSIRSYYKDIEKKVEEITKDMKFEGFKSCKANIAQKLGCQARCPGCGAKCSKPEPHDNENVEVWQDPCKSCPKNNCTCQHPEPMSVVTHETTYHLAGAFHGWRYHKLNTPNLELCYQKWKTVGIYVPKKPRTNDSKNDEGEDEDKGEDEDEGEVIFPRAKYYNQNDPAWYNNLKRQSTEGQACTEDIPPLDQRRAWMVVRHTLIKRYESRKMVDHKEYDKKLYPKNVETLPEDFQPTWKDEIFDQ